MHVTRAGLHCFAAEPHVHSEADQDLMPAVHHRDPAFSTAIFQLILDTALFKFEFASGSGETAKFDRQSKYTDLCQDNFRQNVTYINF